MSQSDDQFGQFDAYADFLLGWDRQLRTMFTDRAPKECPTDLSDHAYAGMKAAARYQRNSSRGHDHSRHVAWLGWRRQQFGPMPRKLDKQSRV